jgi:predicted TIM-barrel fold metal-dependent hydrolase
MRAPSPPSLGAASGADALRGSVLAFPVVSADCHVTEPGDLWLTQLPASLRERGPRIAVRDGRVGFVVEDRLVRKLPVPAAPGSEGAASVDFGWGASDPAERLSALARDGVFAEVIYPNVAFFCCYEIRDPALQLASCRVYNDWVAERFGREPRCAAVGILPALDLGACAAMLREFPARGIRAGLLPVHSDLRPYNDPAWEPVWETAAGMGVPLSFHAGTGRSQTPAHGPGGAVVNYVVTLAGAIETVAYLCGSGVLERHPELRVVMVECGAGWLAWTLEAMDDATREHAAFVRPKLRELPSFYFRRQGAVTFQRDPVGLANLAATGERCLLWGSDYPHPEGTWPESQQVLARDFAGVPQASAERILCRNAAELYGIPLPEASSGSRGIA